MFPQIICASTHFTLPYFQTQIFGEQTLILQSGKYNDRFHWLSHFLQSISLVSSFRIQCPLHFVIDQNLIFHPLLCSYMPFNYCTCSTFPAFRSVTTRVVLQYWRVNIDPIIDISWHTPWHPCYCLKSCTNIVFWVHLSWSPTQYTPNITLFT